MKTKHPSQLPLVWGGFATRWRPSFWVFPNLFLLVLCGLPAWRPQSAAPAPVPTLRWEPHGAHRRAPVVPAPAGQAGFTGRSASGAGILFTNWLGEERSLTNQIYHNGSGVAAGDVNGDGLTDLYFCGLDSPNALYLNQGNWRFQDVTGPAGVACADQASTGAALADVDGDGDLDLLVTGVARGVRLFLNEGRAAFREAGGESGLRGNQGSASMALADVDGDGRLDLYVVNYRNDTIRDMPNLRLSVGVTNGVYHLLTFNDRPATSPEFAGRFTFDRAGGILENGEADALFRNLGNGRFSAVNWTNGAFLTAEGQRMGVPFDWGLSAMFRDMNGDGAPDLYVCNDFQSPDRIWINDGRGQFRAIRSEAIRQTSLFSMGVDFADIDRDGQDDFFVADMLSREHSRRQVQVMDGLAFSQVRQPRDPRPQFSRNTLFRNRGNGTYAEMAQFSGVDASEWSWCPAFLDVDLDGYEDLLVTTGHLRDAQHADIAREIEEIKKQRRMTPLEQLRLRKRFPILDTPNVAFRNQGDLTFREISADWGFDSRRISQGMALADLDNDGDLDVVINCLNDAPLLLRNNAARPRVAVRLRGQAPNTGGVGARIRVAVPGLPEQSQEVLCGGRYLSSDDFTRTFAAGASDATASIEVRWRSGLVTRLSDVPANWILEISEPNAPAPDVPNSVKTELGKAAQAAEAARAPFFEDVSALLNHSHADEPFDDFLRQPLLPRQLSQLGPGVAWFDFNADGWDDLLIGAGRGGRLGVFRNDGRGRFVRQRAESLQSPMDRDLTSILGWQPNATNLALLFGLANDEGSPTPEPAFRQFSVVTGQSDESALRTPASTGPLALADADADGDLDLFVGGRFLAGRYPEPVSSAFLRNDQGKWTQDPGLNLALREVGLVSAAIFTDLAGDAMPELVLACEWGPLRIFRRDANQPHQWSPWNVPLRWEAKAGSGAASAGAGVALDDLTGWWNSVVSGDFDGDGRLDLAAGNWGRNHSYNAPNDGGSARAGPASSPFPLPIFFGEADGSGDLAVLETKWDDRGQQLVPKRDWRALSSALPVLSERFDSFRAFSAVNVTGLLAGLPRMENLSAAAFESVLLLNRTNHFIVRPLPLEAQLSPVFGLAAGDLDGDGRLDLFLGQNFFAVAPSESRHDAGCGLWLRGDGQGGFTAVSAGESGFAVFGEARGAALSDYDKDGRLDVVVGQNRGETKLYRNLKARPGLRVRLQGPPQNLQAIGAKARLEFESGKRGPAQEIRAGNGYWSQDSPQLVLGLPEPPKTLEIEWPNGRRERVAVGAETRLVTRAQP